MEKGFTVNKKFDKEMNKLIAEDKANEYTRKPMKICVIVDSDTKRFLEGLVCGKNMEFVPTKDLADFDLFEPVTYKMCGDKTNMEAAISNIESKIHTDEPKLKSLKSAVKKIKMKLRK